MNDRAIELLEQYEIEVLRTGKGRGAFLCDTDKGSLTLQEYTGRPEHLALQQKLLLTLQENSPVKTEMLYPTKEGELFVTDFEGTRYVLKSRPEGRECAVFDKGECLEAVRVMARLHGAMKLEKEELTVIPAFDPGAEYEKHNREMKRAAKYLKQKGQKHSFEKNLLKQCDFFLEQGNKTAYEWEQYKHSRKETGKEEMVIFCHGDYQYHNVIYTGEEWFVCNFEKCLRDDQIRDLVLYLRKVLEKANWSPSLGRDILNTYQKEHLLSEESLRDLTFRLAYPEKFWKILNFYFNSSKSWIPGKLQEKLDKVLEQEKAKQEFLRIVLNI